MSRTTADEVTRAAAASATPGGSLLRIDEEVFETMSRVERDAGEDPRIVRWFAAWSGSDR